MREMGRDLCQAPVGIRGRVGPLVILIQGRKEKNL